MPRGEKGILGVRKDPKNAMLFSFKAREGEEWPSDSSDSDFVPPDEINDNIESREKKKKRSKSNKKRKIVSRSDDDSSNEGESSKTKKDKTSTFLQCVKLPKRKNSKHKSEDTSNSTIEYSEMWSSFIPVEIMVKIFKYVLENEGSIKFLKKAAFVCKRWREAAADPSLWEKVDLSFGWIKQSESTFKWLCENRFSNLKEVSFSKWKALQNQHVDKLLDWCPNLKVLDLSSCQKISSQATKCIAEKGQGLEQIDLSKVQLDCVSPTTLKYLFTKQGPTLKSITLGENTLRGFKTCFTSVMEHCRNLEVLDLNNVIFGSDFFAIPLEKFQAACPKLRVLRLTNSRCRADFVPEREKQESKGFPNLEEFSIGVNDVTNSGLDDDFFNRVLKHSKKLRLLDLRGCVGLSNAAIKNVEAENLQQLYISQSTVAKYEGIEIIMQKWQHSLVELDLSWNIFPGASFDIAMKKLSSHPHESKLKILNLSGTSVSCERIKSILKGCLKLSVLNLNSCRGLPRGMKREYSGEQLERLRKEIDNFEDTDEYICF